MTNTGGTPAGWYHAPGDPEGTQRYWDGAQWIGDPQAVPQQPTPQAPAAPQAPLDSDATVAYTPPAAAGQAPQYDAPQAGQQEAVPGGQPPQYGAAPAGAAPAYGSPPPGAGAPPGYQAYGGASTGVGQPAEWSTRFVAYLIDWGIGVGLFVVGLIISVIAGAIADVLGTLMIIVTYLAVLGYWIWNVVIQQGTTGKTIGKDKQGIKLVKDDTGQPVGAGMAFVRYLVASAISFFTCGIGGLLDYLWPLWDADKKRLTDKIVTMSVVVDK